MNNVETRYLTQVILNGTTKIAQYGRFDGNPASAGAELARWLAECETPRELVLSRINDCTLHPQIALETLIDKNHIHDWEQHYPHLSHTTGMRIIELVTTRGPFALIDRMDFVCAPFCKFHYAIDFDSHSISINNSKWIDFENWTYDLMNRIEELIAETAWEGHANAWVDELNRAEFV